MQLIHAQTEDHMTVHVQRHGHRTIKRDTAKQWIVYTTTHMHHHRHIPIRNTTEHTHTYTHTHRLKQIYRQHMAIIVCLIIVRSGAMSIMHLAIFARTTIVINSCLLIALRHRDVMIRIASTVRPIEGNCWWPRIYVYSFEMPLGMVADYGTDVIGTRLIRVWMYNAHIWISMAVKE